MLAIPARVGIELSPAVCRIVELEPAPHAGGGAPATRVRAFGHSSRQGLETYQRLSTLPKHVACIVAWGLHADHRQVVVARGSFRRMRREAVAAMQRGGVETGGRVADIFAAPGVKGTPTRPVVATLVSTSGLLEVIQWLNGQGVRVESIVTPALALMSLARLRREYSAPDRLEAYVALEGEATAMVLVRNSLLLAAGEIEWGYQDERGRTRPRDEIASRLGQELERFMAARGARPDALAQVCICGGLPDLRSMALGLMEHLDVEVEPLDSLFGVDAARLPEPADDFREHSAELRLAWAAAADWPSPLNLLRERRRRATKVLLSRAAVAAGVVTGVGLAWQLQRSELWRASESRPVAGAPPARRPVVAPTPKPSAGAGSLPAQRPASTAPESAAVVTRNAAPPPIEPRSRAAERPAAPVPAPPAPVAPVPTPTPTPAPPPIQGATSAPATLPPARRDAVRPSPAPAAPSPVSPSQPSMAARLPAETPRVEMPVARSSRQPPAERRRAPEAEVALPFDGVLGTILYAPERRLAIIDGRIVQPGDEVSGARVVDITPTTVLLRDAQGRLRRLGLGAAPLRP